MASQVFDGLLVASRVTHTWPRRMP
jgi:hypothetical protein